MSRCQRWFVIGALLALVAAAGCPCGGAGTSGQADNSAARKERLLANLKARYQHLELLNPTLGDFTRVAPGMDMAQMAIATPQGEQTQTLLVTPDDKALYIVMEGPVDVSRSLAELQAARLAEQRERRRLLTELAADLPFRGAAAAPVTVVEFSDFQCPYSKRGAQTAEQVLEKYPGKVKLVFMHYPLPFHPWARAASIAAVCAARQKPEAFWALHDGYFKGQDAITLDNVLSKGESFVAGSGIDLGQWSTCAKTETSPEYQAAAKAIEDAMAAANKLGVEGTPAFFVNGAFLNGAVSIEEMAAEIEQALKQPG
ncbi:MAG: thioredoxin domain-containing protein [Deltaproteobacteria bacterium]|nr:thioredoxin domain-containing protein [Deltaproteobacteria bacterium]